jgi:hypothetical protein
LRRKYPVVISHGGAEYSATACDFPRRCGIQQRFKSDYEWSRHTQAIEEAKAADLDPILA